MQNQSVQVTLNVAWLREIIERHLHRRVNAATILEITRESVFVLENALASGLRTSLSDAIAEALDTLEFMDEQKSIDVTGFL